MVLQQNVLADLVVLAGLRAGVERLKNPDRGNRDFLDCGGGVTDLYLVESVISVIKGRCSTLLRKPFFVEFGLGTGIRYLDGFRFLLVGSPRSRDGAGVGVRPPPGLALLLSLLDGIGLCLSRCLLAPCCHQCLLRLLGHDGCSVSYY